jgi:hypothetical protein
LSDCVLLQKARGDALGDAPASSGFRNREVPRLERKLQRELDDPRIARLRDLPEAIR